MENGWLAFNIPSFNYYARIQRVLPYELKAGLHYSEITTNFDVLYDGIFFQFAEFFL